MQTFCKRCGQPFVCGVVAGQAHCWCFDLPHRPLREAGGRDDSAGCYCPACLDKLVAEVAANFRNS